jgi:hypothetical protein
MTLEALTSELHTVQRRVAHELTVSRPAPQTRDGARALVALLLDFEYRWAARRKLASQHPREDWKRGAA